jgi:hypothetical protein
LANSEPTQNGQRAKKISLKKKKKKIFNGDQLSSEVKVLVLQLFSKGKKML